ncbi:winged helix-turn-helix domain-containing protein [Brevibacterium litoralis]|uniref:winged helix-turn-helix domain-containing protein n=1 Tax=Brevibacterium litoralis TaxID=3138935 RepID=UPI0032EE002E
MTVAPITPAHTAESTSTTPDQAEDRAHPRSAAATRRRGTPLTPVDPRTAPRTYGPAGVSPGPQAARGIVLYIGLDESKAAEDGTNLAAIAHALQEYAHELSTQAQTQAIIALAPQGLGSDLDAVRAVNVGSSAASGKPAGRHGPVRSRVPGRLRPPAARENVRPVPEASSGLRIDIPRREVHIDDSLVTVTTKEFDLLATLVSSPGSTLSRDDLIDALWTGDSERPDDRTVDVHVRRLRKRLGDYSSVVRTIRGLGYRYDEHPDVQVWTATASR